MLLNLHSPYASVSDEIVHPAIIRTPNGQFKYCIAYTPYPKSDFLCENPCVAYTNDFISYHYFGIQPSP